MPRLHQHFTISQPPDVSEFLLSLQKGEIIPFIAGRVRESKEFVEFQAKKEIL